MTATVDLLMDAAESGMRRRGYHAVSFRELADELGIKSSSVHYYFRQKEQLGVAVVERYTARFFAALEARTVSATTAEERLHIFLDVYREAMIGADRICLCGMLGAESHGLPTALSEAVAAFFRASVAWLAEALPERLPEVRRQEIATRVVATLQGAMIMATTMKDPSRFDMAAADLVRSIPGTAPSGETDRAGGSILDPETSPAGT